MDIGWKVVSGLASAAAGFAASKAVDTGWKGVTGRETPVDDADDDYSMPEILTFAIVSAVALAVAQVVATQTAKRWYRGAAVGRAELDA